MSDQALRLATRPTVYRGEAGYLVYGRDTFNRAVSVFVAGDKAAAAQVKTNIRAGRDPFTNTQGDTP